MDDQQIKRNKYFYLDFRIFDTESFEALVDFFNALKREKDLLIQTWETHNPEIMERSNSSLRDPATDPRWTGFLTDQALLAFTHARAFPEEEDAVYYQLWDLTLPEVRTTHPMFVRTNGWDFEAMLAALFDGEYVLITIERDTIDQAVLYYDPWAGPFGGSEALVALVEAFGHQVTYDSWHGGPHKRRTIGWDYQQAKALVQLGQGVVAP